MDTKHFESLSHVIICEYQDEKRHFGLAVGGGWPIMIIWKYDECDQSSQ